MPITLFTGLPGAGKTAQLVAEIVRLGEEEPGRPVFAMGINGLKEGLAAELTMEQLQEWWELPPGSIVAIDECQEDHLMPRDRGTPEAWVQRLAKVRHYGMDFLLTTQAPGNMSSFVRRLVTRHVHTVRQWNSSAIFRFEWQRCIDTPDGRADRKAAIRTIGTLPANVFDLYKSSQLHTMKRKVPAKFYMFVAVLLLAVVALVSIPFAVRHAKNGAIPKGVEVSKDAGVAVSSAKAADADLRTKDYVKWMTPRVAGIPWTAPAFDGQQVRSTPRLACMQLETGECHCVTEQGTRVEMPLAMCKAVVQDGIYNPFVASDGGDGARRIDSTRRDQAKPPAESNDVPPAPVSVATRTRATATAYVPPTYGPREPDEPLRFQH